MSDKVRLCAVCRKDISERVEILPETWLCREHAGMIEKYGGEFTVVARQESLGKAGSLKKNYGGVNVQRTRNMAALEKLQAEYERMHQGAESE
jgi:hypothetical protein